MCFVRKATSVLLANSIPVYEIFLHNLGSNSQNFLKLKCSLDQIPANRVPQYDWPCSHPMSCSHPIHPSQPFNGKPHLRTKSFVNTSSGSWSIRCSAVCSLSGIRKKTTIVTNFTLVCSSFAVELLWKLPIGVRSQYSYRS